jgi:hypothetical protein
MLSKKITAGLVGMSAVVGLVAMAPTAQAAPDRSCYDGNFCIYKDRDFSTDNSMYRTKIESGRWDIDMPAVDENDSSWRNRRAKGSRTFGGRWMTLGTEICVIGGGQVNYYWDANDDGASHRLNQSC